MKKLLRKSGRPMSQALAVALLFATLVLIAAFTIPSLTAYARGISDEQTDPNGRTLISVSVEYSGAVMTTHTEAVTVGQLLERMGIDFSSVMLGGRREDELLTEGDRVEVIGTDSGVEQRTVEVPFETVYAENPELFEGTERITQEGQAGAARSTIAVAYAGDGKELYSEEIFREIITEPTPEIAEMGTKQIPDYQASGAGSFATAEGDTLRYSQAISCIATAYTTERQSWKLTYSGTVARVGAIAVDPKVIPLGAQLYICYPDGSRCYGYAVAEDTGGLIKGNIIDLFYDTYDECIQWGRREVTVYVLS